MCVRRAAECGQQFPPSDRERQEIQAKETKRADKKALARVIGGGGK
jgi:hypothetical protein